MSDTTIRDIAQQLENWAPTRTAQSYDNVGLQVGRSGSTVTRAIVALDLTPDVIQEAEDCGAELIITHHPLVFRPLKRLTDDSFVSGLALGLAEKGIALYSIHTNLDAASGGVSFALARQLGLNDVTFLAPLEGQDLRKIVTYVPETHAESVRRAMHEAGAGNVGDYSDVSFSFGGTGAFTPDATANPAIGAPGLPETVSELRIEMYVPGWASRAVIEAARSAHPYQEMAYDLIPLEQADTRTGLGAIGRLDHAMELRAFLDRTSGRLGTPAVRYVGDLDAHVETVAVCGGSGSEFTGAAIKAGADVYVTGDITYHRYFEVLGLDGKASMALVDAGHYETEAVTEALLVDFLGREFPHVDWRKTAHRTSPMQVHVVKS